MRITYLIGNGFDISLGLKTSYSDFYEYYVSKSTKDVKIQKVKDNLTHYLDSDGKSCEIVDWKDLEVALGQLSSQFSNPEDFSEVYDDINLSLREYIEMIDTETSDLKQFSTIFIGDLRNPFQYLKKSSKENITNSILRYYRDDAWNIDFISFNYTFSLEKILSRDDLRGGVGPNGITQRSVLINSINHIHHTYDETILLGLNDESQISNVEFQKNDEVLDFLIKQRTQRGMRALVDDDCRGIIDLSDMIIIFGMSLGPSDNVWWRRIIDHCLMKDCQIIIFIYNPLLCRKTEHLDYKMAQLGRNFLRDLLKQVGLTLPIEHFDLILSRLFLVYHDHSIFDFSKRETE